NLTSRDTSEFQRYLLTIIGSYPHFSPFFLDTPWMAGILKYICAGKIINTN
ncbi:MAG: hypothetical protein ACI837_001917, partial [Crocinitomicaceae bacterium]